MNKSLWLFSLVFFLSFCGIKKTSNEFFDTPKDYTEIIERVNSKNYYPEWLCLRGKAHIVQNNKSISLNINIKNRKDSIIWVSASGPFGIEIIRAQLTPTSIYFLNRVNKTFLIQPISEIKQILKSDFSFFDVQDIIMANPKIFKNMYDLKLTKMGYYLFSDNFNYTVNKNYRIEQTNIKNNNNNLEIVLEEHQISDNFPRKISFKVEAEDPLELAINYSKVTFNKTGKISFKIPDSYEEVK